jgi:hypothetical protein
MAGDDKTQIGIPMPEAPWRREWVWAEPVDVDDGTRAYRLLNTSMCAPYVVEDLVTVRRSGRHLVLDGLYERGGRTGWLVEFSADALRQSVVALVDEWASTGAAVEGLAGPFYSVAVVEDSLQCPTHQELAGLANDGTIVAFELITEPGDGAPPRVDQLDVPSEGVAW